MTGYISLEEAQKLRRSRAFAKLSKQVRAEEPYCWLRLPGCTSISTTADHIIPVTEAPWLVMERSNLRGACKGCNDRRQATPIAEILRHDAADALGFFSA